MDKHIGISQTSNQQKKQLSCDSFHGTIEFIGKRWMGIIIYHLLDGPKRYYELAETIEGISDRLLTERLRELEAQGFVLKKTAGPGTRRVEYELTSIGRDMEEIIQAIRNWVKVHGCSTSEKEV
ncbi:winged helix-turn-helix transcriptional regulator [Sporosarcina sp. CAU 1771]